MARSAKKKWDESKVSRDESGRFIAQAGPGHRDNAHQDRYGRDVTEFMPQNNFDPTRVPTFERIPYGGQGADRTKPGYVTPQSLPKPVKPQRGSMFIQVGGKTYIR